MTNDLRASTSSWFTPSKTAFHSPPLHGNWKKLLHKLHNFCDVSLCSLYLPLGWPAPSLTLFRIPPHSGSPYTTSQSCLSSHFLGYPLISLCTDSFEKVICCDNINSQNLTSLLMGTILYLQSHPLVGVLLLAQKSGNKSCYLMFSQVELSWSLLE